MPGRPPVSSSPIVITAAFSPSSLTSANSAWRDLVGRAPVRSVPRTIGDAAFEVLRTRTTPGWTAPLAAPRPARRLPRDRRRLRVWRGGPPWRNAAKSRAYRRAGRDGARGLRAGPHSCLAPLHVPGRRLRRRPARRGPRGSGRGIRARARASRPVRAPTDLLQRGGRGALRTPSLRELGVR